MNRLTRVRSKARSTVPGKAEYSAVDWPRVLAVVTGGTLIGSYLAVFYHVVDVVGGVRWFTVGVGAAFVLATVVARSTSVRGGLVLGSLLLAGGIATYLLFVPTLHERLFTVEFVVRWFSFMEGLSVLGFRRVDLWAIAVAPGPTFLSWFLLLARRYDASAIVSGLMLGFFVLTGDAGATTTLVGATSLLGMLGAGTIERDTGTIRELSRLGFVLALAVVVARTVTIVPDTAARSTGGSGGGGGSDAPPRPGGLENADEQAHIDESISLSPTVFFTVESARESVWRVGAYDRYTGSDWIRTGESTAYEGPRSSPPGESIPVEQTFRAERPVGTLPAAWKPVEIHGLDAEGIRVTEHGGLTLTRALERAETYRVRSEVPDVTADVLRAAGEEYPTAIRERYLQLPGNTPDRVFDLAQEVAGGAPTPYDAAVVVRLWLSREKEYDLSVDRPPGDVVDAFLFSMDRGYCVYFASAMVALLRALELPSRFVLGYTAGQPVGADRWVVRGFDSHAWVEVYFPGHGWVGFDPTPGDARREARVTILEGARSESVSGIDTDESRGVSARSLDTEVESARVNVTTSNDTTADVGRNQGADIPAEADASGTSMAGESAAGDSDAVVDEGRPVGAWLAERDRIALLAGAAGASIGLHWLGVFQSASRTVRLRWQRPTDSPGQDVVRAYDRFELLLSHRYRERSPGETRRRYLEETVGVSEVRRTRRLIDLYERASYGSGVTRAEADEAIGIVDAFVAAKR